MNAERKWCAASYLVRESSGSFTEPNYCLVLPAIRFAGRIKMEGDREGYRGLVRRPFLATAAGAAALPHKEIVIEVSLRDRLCQVVSHCLVHGHLRRHLNEQSLQQCDRTLINSGSSIVFKGRSDGRRGPADSRPRRRIDYA